jgi:hypothetical protein
MMNLMIFGLSKPTKQSLVVKLGKDIQKIGTKVMEKKWETFQGFFLKIGGIKAWVNNMDYNNKI